MLQAFVITLREGLAAFLIVAASLAYLRKTGRHALVPALHWGIGVSVLLSIAAGALLSRTGNQALWEGLLAWVAAVLVASVTVRMWRDARPPSGPPGTAAFLGAFGFTLIMVTREGMQTAVLMNALLFQVRSLKITSGAVGGTLVAACLAWLWSRYGHRVRRAPFLQVTALFLALFVVQLVVDGLHGLTEANLFTYGQPLHDATAPFGPDGVYGPYLTYMLVLVPIAWLAISSLFAHRIDP